MRSTELTQEWAKQIAFEAWGNLPFDTMRVINVPKGMMLYRIPIPRLATVIYFSDVDSTPDSLPIEYEEIGLHKYGWPLMGEYYIIGYGQKTNTLLFI